MRTVAQEVARFTWPTPKEAGQRIGGVSTDHVMQLVADGELRARDVSRKDAKRRTYVIDPASIEEFCERRMVQPTKGAA